MASYNTLAAESRHEIDKIKGSRFIATLAPVADEAQCAEFADRVRTEYPDARHHCLAWRLGRSGNSFRYDDDGEPSGSAGKPILRAIDSLGLTDTIVVVTRYFGGTKLGVGGLTRAYGGCAKESLGRAEITTVRITKRYHIRYAYGLSGSIQGLLAATDLTVVESGYGAEVAIVVDVPEELAMGFLQNLRDATAGRVAFEEV